MERTYSAEETAKMLGLCLDSVRRHFRSGKMPGVRVGRNWRIAHSQLEAYLGVASTPGEAAPALPSAALETQDIEKNEVVTPLLRTAPVRARVLHLVEQTAINTNLRPKNTKYLLDDLDALLGSNKE